jgi:RNA polymerase sigma-70 factor, ECF subfamily
MQTKFHMHSAGAAEPLDESLIDAVASRDDSAMSVLYERHKIRTYRFILRIVKDQVLAEDILSEVFLHVWRRAGEFKFLSRVSTWILAIARYQALTAVGPRTHATADLSGVEDMADPADTPEDLALVRDRNTQLRLCISALSAEHREIIDLAYYQGQTIADIAQILSVPESTVKTRMFYARKKLRELLLQRKVVVPEN